MTTSTAVAAASGAAGAQPAPGDAAGEERGDRESQSFEIAGGIHQPVTAVSESRSGGDGPSRASRAPAQAAVL